MGVGFGAGNLDRLDKEFGVESLHAERRYMGDQVGFEV